MTSFERYRPVLSETVVRDRAAAFAQQASADAPILLLRSVPEWSGPASYQHDRGTVRVVKGLSPLAVLDALEARAKDEFLLVLTDRTEQELGSAITLRSHRQGIETIDEWSLVPGLFGAVESPSQLRAIGGKWFPTLALERAPAKGWPRVPVGVLTAEFALSAVLASTIGRTPGELLDAALLIEQLDKPAARQSWNSLDHDVQKSLAFAAGVHVSPIAPLILHAVGTGTPVSVVAIGLALEVLFPATGTIPSAEQIAARTRAEKYVGGNLAHPTVREFADTAIAVLLRLDAEDDSTVPHYLAQAEALLADLGWSDGALQSPILPAGLTHRVREAASFAAVSTEHAPASGEQLSRMEDALTAVTKHQLVHRHSSDVLAIQMAVRLARWRTVTPVALPSSFSAAIDRYASEWSWVDRSAAALWNGSTDPETAASYSQILAAVRGERAATEEKLSALITGADIDEESVFGIERALTRVIAPLAKQQPILVIVLDGMSVSVASEIAQEMPGLGWLEMVPAAVGKRVSMVATLPSITNFSRASFFSGRLVTGGQDVEKAGFTAALAGRIFHKDDLRSEGGTALPTALTTLVADKSQRVVAVVLNTIDDALAKHDPGGTRWNLQSVTYLRPLLAQAAEAGRDVVFTSDHGHVIERSSELRPFAGAGARWRSPESGPLTAGEIRVSGPRVLAPGATAVLLHAEDVRYTPKAAGYHGGASLAELTVPLQVYRRVEFEAPTGWADAVPAAPLWWNDRVPPGASLPSTAAVRAVKPSKKAPVTDPFQLSFDMPSIPEASGGATSLAARLLASEVFQSQRVRAGRGALDDEVVRALIETLEGGANRAHRDTLATAAGIPAVRFGATFAALRRLLNVEAYDVVRIDADGVTIHLDATLLREQFRLGKSA
jgi:hypothetical protein